MGFFKMYVWERKREREQGRGRERQSQASSTLPAQSLMRGSIPRTSRSWPEKKPRARCLTNWAPQTPLWDSLFIAKVMYSLEWVRENRGVQRKIQWSLLPILLNPFSAYTKSTLNIKTHIDIWRGITLGRFWFCFLSDLVPHVNLLLVLLTKHHEHPSRSTHTQIQAS